MTDGSGVLDARDFFSPANDRRFAVWSWRPDGPGPFPLLVLLHGVYDSGGHGWWLRARVHEQLAGLVAAGELTSPPVVLMPTDTGASQGSGYTDWADGTTKAETFVVDELLPWAAQELPVDDRRWITGLSMGGYGALMLALRHPGTFASATATSGFFDPRRLLTFVPAAESRIWGGAERIPDYDVTRLVTDPDRLAGLRLALDCGTEDHLIDQSRGLHAQLTELGVPHGYAEHPGAHDWDYWRAHVLDHVRFHAGLPGPLADR
jgi:S-formylglutathione hydrolase FrmB